MPSRIIEYNKSMPFFKYNKSPYFLLTLNLPRQKNTPEVCKTVCHEKVVMLTWIFIFINVDCYGLFRVLIFSLFTDQSYFTLKWPFRQTAKHRCLLPRAQQAMSSRKQISFLLNGCDHILMLDELLTKYLYLRYRCDSRFICLSPLIRIYCTGNLLSKL